jgi:hypothetical protein
MRTLLLVGVGMIAAAAYTTHTAYAITTGPFFTIDGGYSAIKSPIDNVFGKATPLVAGDIVTTITNNHTRGGMGEAVGFGYRFNDRSAVSFTAAHLPLSNYEKKECEMHGQDCVATADSALVIGGNTLKAALQLYQPLNQALELRVDMGAALLLQTVRERQETTDDAFVIPGPEGHDRLVVAVRPVAAFAIQRKIADTYELGFTWSRVFGKGHVGDDRYMPNQDAFQIEFRVYFGGKLCV